LASPPFEPAFTLATILFHNAGFLFMAVLML
jgi:hypothetical protein